MCFVQVVLEHLITTSYLNSFFLSTQQIFLQAKHKELYCMQSLKCTLNFQKKTFQGGQHTCRYFELANEREKEN